jgi:hypothetical protein
MLNFQSQTKTFFILKVHLNFQPQVLKIWFYKLYFSPRYDVSGGFVLLGIFLI